jgi:hypothetical protein
VIDQNSIERAMQLHESLVSYGISARDVPATIFKTQALYRQAIFLDQQHFHPEVLSEPYDNQEEIQAMKVLLNKFAHYHLHDHDVKALQSLNFSEADHLRAYLQFEHQSLTYVKFIRDYLLKLKVEISVKAGNKHDAKEKVPAFYKHGEAPNGVKKLQHILKNIEREDVPVNILKIYSKVCDVLDNIPPSKTRPAATTAFYHDHCHEIKMFSFIPPTAAGLDESEEDVSSLSASM